jgi:hypothetical protein
VWSNSTVEMISAGDVSIVLHRTKDKENVRSAIAYSHGRTQTPESLLPSPIHSPSVMSSTSPLSPKHWAKRQGVGDSASIVPAGLA